MALGISSCRTHFWISSSNGRFIEGDVLIYARYGLVDVRHCTDCEPEGAWECVRTKDLVELKRTLALASCIDGGLSYMLLVKGASEGSFDALQH